MSLYWSSFHSIYDADESDRESAEDLESEDESCENNTKESEDEDSEVEEDSEADEDESPEASLPEEVSADSTEIIDNTSSRPTPSNCALNENKIIIHDVVQTAIDDELETEKRELEYEQYLKELENCRQDNSKIDESKRA